ncbi:hypothetical protein Tco_1542044 [Tanacetum coccineum]
MMALDLTCPSTSQLLQSISLVLARASLAAISKLLSLSGCSRGNYTSSRPPSLVLSLSSSSYFPVMSKNDIKDRICSLSKNDLKDLVKTYRIPLDLHPRLPDPRFTMVRLPADAIGIYFEFLQFSSIRVPLSTFLLSVLKYFKVYISQLVPLGLNKVVSFEDVCMDDGPSSLKKWKKKFFLIDRRAISDRLTWRHSCSCVSDDVPSDGYDRNDVQRLCARLICLREMREEVPIRSGLISMWFNKECDSLFQRVDDNAESHHLSLLLLERVPSHTTAPTTKGAIIPLPTPDEIAASLPDSRLVKNSKDTSHASRPSKKRKLQKRDLEAGSSDLELDHAEGTDEADLADLFTEIENSLERDEGVSMRAISAPTLRLSKRLCAPPSIAFVSASEPSYVGTSAPASTSCRSLSLGGVATSGCVGKSGAEYDQIPDDDFGTATRGEEIDLTLFPLALGPYHMPYPYEGVSSPLYTREEWNGPHAPERSILCKDIFKDTDV